MSDVTLEKTRTVLRLDTVFHTTYGFKLFDNLDPDDEESGQGHVMFLDGDVWKDLGSPDAITVTIEPGDLLNTPPDMTPPE